MEYDISIVTILIGVVVYLIYDTYVLGAREYVMSAVDAHKYLVRSLPDKQAAADLLAVTGKKLQTLTSHMQKMSPNDPRTLRLVEKFKPENICEGVDSKEYTSYSVNKGEQIIFCLRQKDKNNTLVDENTIVFVAIHELAHICTESIGHTDEFWQNFRWLLQEAIQIGIYAEQDYKAKPQQYCGINITSSPLD